MFDNDFHDFEILNCINKGKSYKVDQLTDILFFTRLKKYQYSPCADIFSIFDGFLSVFWRKNLKGVKGLIIIYFTMM